MIQRISNFGKNVAFTPEQLAVPRSADELLEMLARVPARPIRCYGSRHAWSPLIETTGLAVSLEHLNHTLLVESEGEQRVRVGAGCKVKRLIGFLDQHQLTLPSLGLIDEQTVAGATATGTHGSGNHSLSHFVRAVRLAYFDHASSQWKLSWIRSEDQDIKAARCSLGALGVVTELEMAIRPQYNVEEHFKLYPTLEEVLCADRNYPLQQFFLIPWRWDFLAQHRKEISQPRSWSAPLYRLFWLAGMDIGLHFAIHGLGNYLPSGSSKFAFRYVLPNLVPRRWRVVDRSDRQLTMQHDLFRHIEIEVFVPRSRLAEMLRLTRELLERCDQKSPSLRYEHHYPICIRKVLPDDTLLSPAAGGDEPWDAVSFISYNHPQRRHGFLEFAREIAEAAAHHCGARPHWGKVCPLGHDELQRLYPGMSQFREASCRYDRSGDFRNGWLESRLRLQEIDDQIPAPSPSMDVPT